MQSLKGNKTPKFCWVPTVKALAFSFPKGANGPWHKTMSFAHISFSFDFFNHEFFMKKWCNLVDNLYPLYNAYSKPNPSCYNLELLKNNNNNPLDILFLSPNLTHISTDLFNVYMYMYVHVYVHIYMSHDTIPQYWFVFSI